MVQYNSKGPFVNNGPPAVNADFLNAVEQAIAALASENTDIDVAIGAIQAKLGGIAEGATANQADDYLLDLGNHNGDLAQSRVTGLVDALAERPVAITGTKEVKAFVYSDINTPRPTASTAVMIYWLADNPSLTEPLNALDFDRVDLLGA